MNPTKSESAPEELSADERELARLLREAGPRQEVDPEHLSQIRAEAHREWRQATARRRADSDHEAGESLPRSRLQQNRDMEEQAADREANVTPANRGRWLAVAAGILLVGLVSLYGVRRSDTPVQVASVDHLSNATVLRSDERLTLAEGTAILAGDELVVERGGSVSLQLESGHAVRLRSGSRLIVRDSVSFELVRGTVYVASGASYGPGGESGGLVVHTMLGAVSEIGTQFEVALQPTTLAMTVRVREGAVELRSVVTEGVLRAHAGERIVVEESREPRIEPLQLEAESWSWVLEAAPPIELDGRAVSEVLYQAARELGHELRFADPAARERANALLSSPPLAAADAWEVALQAGGLEASREGRVQIVVLGPEAEQP